MPAIAESRLSIPSRFLLVAYLYFPRHTRATPKRTRPQLSIPVPARSPPISYGHLPAAGPTVLKKPSKSRSAGTEGFADLVRVRREGEDFSWSDETDAE